MIRPVENQDIHAWLELAKEVEPLFGQMVECLDFKREIKNFISNSSAFCMINAQKVEGIVAINKSKNEIAWLAVRKQSHKKGYGNQLLKTAIERLDNKKPILVQTFSSNVKAGEAVRKLYMRFGFQDYKAGGKNPAGMDTVIMKLESSG